MKVRVPRPTYANVTATVALVLALGGTSYAAVVLPKNSVGSKQIKANAVKSADVKNDALTGSDVKEAALGVVPDAAALEGRGLRGISQWAYLDSVGTTMSASGTVAGTMLDVGRYRVEFPASVAGCGLNANVTSAVPIDDTTTLPSAFALVARSSTNARSVVVQVHDAAGTLVGRPFVVTVQC